MVANGTRGEVVAGLAGAERRLCLTLGALGRFPFYAAARGSDVALVIATGEQRVYANLLLTIGVVPPAGGVSATE